MERILSIMRRLRQPNGCPWDRKQTLGTLRKCVLEEAHEVVEAIHSGRRDKIEEEIGDMLCVVSLLIALGEEKGWFGKASVVKRAKKKMIARHPHVFAKEKARTAKDAIRLFTRVKEEEKRGHGHSLLEDWGKGQPALMAAERIQKKVARVGFDWKDTGGVLRKIEEEIRELRRAVSSRRRRDVEEEMGDLLFSLVNLARKLSVEAETALLRTNAKFRKRFQTMEDLAAKRGSDLSSGKLSLRILNRLWEEAKLKPLHKRLYNSFSHK
jgi:MazG family protein